MTRDEALKYAENKYSCNSYRCEMGYLNRGLSTIAERENEFLRVAISALREQGATDNNVGGKLTNADRIRAMSDEELAEWIRNGISTDPCDYCEYNNGYCDGSPCRGKTEAEIITEWLKQPAEDTP